MDLNCGFFDRGIMEYGNAIVRDGRTFSSPKFIDPPIFPKKCFGRPGT